MRKWLMIGGTGAVVGYVAVYLALDVKPAPEPGPEQPTVAAAPAEPVVLADVVEVTNLEPLLAPRSAEPTGVPFDAAEPLEAAGGPRAIDPEPGAPTAAPVPIPPAAEEPTDRQGAAPAVDPSRVVWYGDQRLPRQLSEFPPAGVWHLREWERGRVVPGGVTVGVGFYF
ncbi:MAG: hypothetical protein J0I06_04515 [Planctomycetes bacterium]|nr:hypothetical protein [Planctomycetota bacterium]